jgi:dipeptidyl aminopeptidase/acylaminoacyl peptidase
VLALAAAGLVAAGIAVVAARPSASSAPSTIPAAELARYPTIVFTWAEPGHVRHTRTGDLYVVNADGSGLRRVRSWPRAALRNDGLYGAAAAVWSPDRSSIGLQLAMWEGDPSFATAVASADGRSLRRVGPWEGTVSGIDWLPDGRGLVFSWSDEVRIHSPSSRRTRRIFRARPIARDTRHQFPDVDVAPDGRRIAAASVRRGVYAMAADGTDVMRLSAGADTDPEWSPDGRTIAFTRSLGWYGSKEQVWTVRGDGEGTPRRLVRRGLGPRWSPDGRWIAFTSRGGVASLVSRDGGELRRLAKGQVMDWSPDGRKILFVRESAEGDLWVMDADGGRQTPLLSNQLPWSVVTADWRS